MTLNRDVMDQIGRRRLKSKPVGEGRMRFHCFGYGVVVRCVHDLLRIETEFPCGKSQRALTVDGAPAGVKRAMKLIEFLRRNRFGYRKLYTAGEYGGYAEHRKRHQNDAQFRIAP